MRINMASILGVILSLLGAGAVIGSIYLAYVGYETYKPILPQAESLDIAITYSSYELINLAIKLGFMGIMVWGGGVLLKHGLHSVVEVSKKGGAECTSQQR
jgi:hypothetical protein